MKPRRVVQVALLGLALLAAAPVEAGPPGAATLVAPSGVVPAGTIVFAWQAAEAATFYYLQVNDATASPRLTLWFPATQACPGGSATCLVPLTTGFAAGSAIFWVQTWNPDGLGPWSTGLSFTVAYVPGTWSLSLGGERFQLVLGGQVLDRETGLVWERGPQADLLVWASAINLCTLVAIGNRKGWRLPSVQELMSLVDPLQGNPALPLGHPFGGVANANYWTATVGASDAATAVAVNLGTGGASSLGKTLTARRWCVRGGRGTNTQ